MNKISFSPTAIQTYVACERKSYFEKPMGIKQPQTASQLLGEQIHGYLEEYYRGGLKPAEERSRESLKNLPRPGGMAVRCESGFTIAIDDYREINGRDDLTFEDRGIPHVIDHKSSSDPEKWGKTPEELTEDIQVNLYAYKALQEHPEADSVWVSHHYIATKGAVRSFLTTTEEPLPRADVEGRFKKYLHIIDNMTETWQLPHAINAKPTGKDNGHCRAFGGCHVKQQCDTLIFSGLRKGKDDMTVTGNTDLKARLAALKANVAPPASPAASAEAGRKRVAAPPEPEETEEQEEAPTPPPKRAPAAAKAPKAAPAPVEPPPAAEVKAGPILLINCIAHVGIEQVSLETWFAPYCAMIEEQTGKNWQLHGYREGCVMVEQCIESAEDFPEALLIDGTSYLGKTALPALLNRNPQAVIYGVG